MLNQSFSLKNFQKLKKLGDLNKYFQGCSPKEIDVKLQKIVHECENINNYSFPPLQMFKQKNKMVYKLPKNAISADFVLRKINYNIKRIYGVFFANRNQIIEQIKYLIQENTDFYIYKFDIDNFYESIDSKIILNKIINSRLTSSATKQLLRCFFDNLSNVQGLPRGINLSATLSEIYMHEFDEYTKNLEGVFYYARYVDDIICFTTIQIDESKLKNRLPNLHFNSQKTYFKKLVASTRVIFDYLGYTIEKKASTSKRKISEVNITIAEKKIKKIKSKIFLAMYNYNKANDFVLLKKRLLYLTSCFPLKEKHQKVFNEIEIGVLHGGILHSYPLIDENCNELLELDNYLKILIFKSNLVKNLSLKQKRALARISFVQSFKRKIKRNFPQNSINNIVRCWRNV